MAALAAIALSFLLPVPAAAGPLGAVEPDVAVDFRLPLEPLDPLLAAAGEEGFAVRVEVTYRVPSAAYSPRPTRVELQVKEIPPWLTAGLEPSEFEIDVDEPAPLGALVRTYVRESTLRLSSAGGSPPLTDGSIVLKVLARENGAIAEADAMEHGLVRVTVASWLDAVPQPLSVSPEPGDPVVVPVLVRNLGASAVVANATLVAVPRGVTANLTAPDTELAHAGAPGRADQTTFLVEITRERGADSGEVVIEVVSRYAAGGLPADARVVRVYVGDDPDAPGARGGGAGMIPGLAFLAAAAVVAGVLVKR